MRYFFKLLSILLLFFLFSCQVNKSLQPWKNSLAKKEYSWKKGQDTYLLKFNGENLQPTFYKNSVVDDRNFSIKSFYFQTRHNRMLNAWLLTSKNEPPQVSVFALHGNSGNLNTQFDSFSKLTEHGFQVFIFDYAGFGFSEGKSTRKNAVEDSFEAFNYFKNLEEVKSQPKIIYGQSIGGNFAVPVAVESQDSVAGLVIEGSFMNFKNIAARKVPVIGGLVIADNYDNRENLKKFKKPVLVIHSSEDKVVPITLGKQIFENANEPKYFYEINQPHIKGIIHYAAEISNKIKTLILDH